jgi:hypothetical protein
MFFSREGIFQESFQPDFRVRWIDVIDRKKGEKLAKKKRTRRRKKKEKMRALADWHEVPVDRFHAPTA